MSAVSWERMSVFPPKADAHRTVLGVDVAEDRNGPDAVGRRRRPVARQRASHRTTPSAATAPEAIDACSR